MSDFLFYLFAALTLMSGLAVVLSRNPVNAVMFMILSLASLGALFVFLEAYFLAVLQILVYAGAVMVLFLFVIMLMNVDVVKKIRPHLSTFMASGIGFIILIFGVIHVVLNPYVISDAQPVATSAQIVADNAFAYTTSAKSFGFGLFTKYLLPIQVSGFLLLLGMVGVIVISKRYDAATDTLPMNEFNDKEEE